MKKFFKINKLKRMLILTTILISSLLAIILGSTFYVSKNVNKSIEYGGGSKYVVKIESTTKAKDSEIATDVANSIYERLDPLGVNGAKTEAEFSNDEATVHITYPGAITKNDRENVERLIVDKPQLILTDVYGNPLFDKYGNFNKILARLQPEQGKKTIDPKMFVGLNYEKPGDFYKYDSNENKKIASYVPLAQNGAKVIVSHDGKRSIALQLSKKRNVAFNWFMATKYISSLPTGKNKIVYWIDPHKFLSKMNSINTDYWKKANGSIYNLAP